MLFVSLKQVVILFSALLLILKVTTYIDSSILLQSIVHSKQFIKVSPVKDLFWRKVFLSCLLVVLPGILLFPPAFVSKYKNYIMSFLRGSSSGNGYDGQSGSNSFTRGFMNRRRLRSNLDLTEEELQEVLKKGGNIGGLVNDGNTCFMNSVLQSLASSNTLIDFLEHEDIPKKELIFTKAFKTLLDNLNGRHLTKNHDYKTNPLLKTMSKTPNKNFLLGYNQEDAQEFFQTILSELESDYKKIHGLPQHSNNKIEAFYNKDLPEGAIHGSEKLGSLGDVFIPAYQIDPNLEDSAEKSFRYNLLTPLDGLSAERIGCLQCGEMGGIRYSVISGLSLNLPPDNYTALRLTDLLKEWIKPEIIEGVDCNRCALKHVLEYQTHQLESLNEQIKEADDAKKESLQKLINLLSLRMKEISTELTKPIIDDDIFKKLHTKNMVKKSSKSKQILISRPPPLLSIHVNRSVFDPTTYRVRKNNAKVIFPLKLDLDQFVAEPTEINTDARLPLSKKVFPEEESEVEDEEDQEQEQEQADNDLKDDSSLTEEELSTPPDSNSNEVSSIEQERFDKDERTSLHEEGASDGEIDDEEERDEEEEDVEELDSDDSDEDEEPRHQTDTLGNTYPSRLEKQDISGPLVYQLRSVIVHYGTHNYGHYIAFRKYRGVWWRTSDETVDIVSEDEVLSTPGVFMLFYELDSLSDSLNKDDQEIEIVGDKKEETKDEKDEKDEEDQQNGQAFTMANL